jgi:hypothetical protein
VNPGLIAELDGAYRPAALSPETRALIGLYAETAGVIDTEAGYLESALAFGWARYTWTGAGWVLELDGDG